MSETEDIQKETYVVSFDDARATERALVGGKGANLARLAGASLPVPDGFCVTTAAYEALIDEPAIEDAIDELTDLDPADTAAIADAGSALRARIQDCAVPEEVRDAIETALDSTANGSDRQYAVRSSATAEDLPEASFAGQQETFLNIRDTDEIIDRVRACMASLFTDRAITYRARSDIPHEETALAVVVQRMVTPEVSGILFTADPMTGNRHIASIEAGLGLGESLVSGEVTADTVRVDTRTEEVLDYAVGDQQVAVRPLSKGGTETVELDLADRTARVLSDDQVQTLVKMGEEIERLFECPQDIEWCFNDGFSIVQARPITSLFPVPSPEPTDDRLHVYYSMGHGQAFAEAMPPLVRDIWKTYTQNMITEWGLDSDTRWVVEAGGRLYVDLTIFVSIGILQRHIPDRLATVSEPIGVALDDLLARRGEELRERWTGRDAFSVLRRSAGTVWTEARMGFPITSSMVGGFFGAFIGEPKPSEHEEARWITWGRTVASQVRTPDTPAERAHAVFEPPEQTVAGDLPSIGPLLAAFTVDGLLKRRFPDASKSVTAVGRGFPDELVTRINLGLGDLADVARDHPDVADALRQGASIDEIESCEGSEAFRDALKEYLGEFGHRATGEIDISRPRWREDPSGLLATVRANLASENGDHREHLHRLEREAKEAAERLEERADHGLLGPIRKRVVHQLIRTYRGYIQTREYPKQGTALLFTAWHDAIRDTGEVLVAEEILDSSEDVWFLRKGELLGALEEDSIDVDIAARRAEFERHAAMDAPPVLTSEGEAPSAHIEREDVPEDALVGTGVSGGGVEGTARVVHDPTEETIETGEILIAPSSDPGWTPLFLNAAGIVVEVGGPLSHGALVAREYGLPAVVAVPEATRRIETGQRVRIDGTQGTVEIIDDN